MPLERKVKATREEWKRHKATLCPYKFWGSVNGWSGAFYGGRVNIAAAGVKELEWFGAWQRQSPKAPEFTGILDSLKPGWPIHEQAEWLTGDWEKPPPRLLEKPRWLVDSRERPNELLEICVSPKIALGLWLPPDYRRPTKIQRGVTLKTYQTLNTRYVCVIINLCESNPSKT